MGDMKMFFLLYVLNMYFLGQVFTKRRELLVQTKKGDWLIKTDGTDVKREGIARKHGSVGMNKKLLEEMLEELDNEDVALFRKLPETKG
eukprot:TRINITY_DN5805_c0_g1_i1.p2 TRINITY_DN5805_c0_g1~~TRINITY_DN5805_c0_g1_i1.p2  ORF type:complete len:104 (-),score=48.44 TRINITY_DN5805_c0_g1_i1:258-524(-)